VRLIPSFEKN